MLAHSLLLVGDDEASDGEEGDCAKGGTGGSLGVVGALSAFVVLKESYSVGSSFFAPLISFEPLDPAIGPFPRCDFSASDPDLVLDHNVIFGRIVATSFTWSGIAVGDVGLVEVGDVLCQVDFLVFNDGRSILHPELQPYG